MAGHDVSVTAGAQTDRGRYRRVLTTAEKYVMLSTVLYVRFQIKTRLAIDWVSNPDPDFPRRFVLQVRVEPLNEPPNLVSSVSTGERVACRNRT